ncbi:hypothetical protein ACIOUE_38565 [Streptomyces xanthochromogenes]|uniref:hypothetical protein n=1 Tax=Streptomyces xanthochromogenes TaxID=67384 RepID=UPI003807BCF5
MLALNRKVPEANKAIAARSRDQQDFVVITSMPGLGMSLGAEFSATTGGGMAVFGTPGPRVGFCGVA